MGCALSAPPLVGRNFTVCLRARVGDAFRGELPGHDGASELGQRGSPLLPTICSHCRFDMRIRIVHHGSMGQVRKKSGQRSVALPFEPYLPMPLALTRRVSHPP